MENIPNPTPEEMQKMLEKAKKELEERLAEMTPEEREQAEIRAKKLIVEDQARIQDTLDAAARVLGNSSQKQQPKYCPNCGAQVSGGKFCMYCGSRF